MADTKDANIENVIFLDIDGPIIPPRSVIAHRTAQKSKYKFHGLTAEFLKIAEDEFWLPDPISVILITHLAEQTNSKIVISSTWRHHGYESFCRDFKRFGFDLDLLHDDWRVPYCKKGGQGSRKREILEWLGRNPQIKKFVTIDDEALDFDTHVQVCAANGFLHDNYVQAYEFLTGEDAALAVSLYNQASVQFLGPKEILDEKPELKRAADRLKDRQAALHRKLSNL